MDAYSPCSSMPRQRYARAIAFTIALSARARGGAHALVPSGANMTLRPPRLRIRSGMSTTSISPCLLMSALVMLPSAHSPDRDAHAIHRPASSALPCAAGRSHGPSGPRLARRGAERCVPARREELIPECLDSRLRGPRLLQFPPSIVAPPATCASRSPQQAWQLIDRGIFDLGVGGCSSKAHMSLMSPRTSI